MDETAEETFDLGEPSGLGGVALVHPDSGGLMKKTTMAVAAGLMAVVASASHAQVGGYPLSYTLGYSGFTGCNVGPAIITLPGSAVYYLPGTGPGVGGIGVGACWFGPTNGTGNVNVPTGWLGLGNGPPPPPPTYNDENTQNTNNSDDEQLPPNPYLVNDTETNDPPGGSVHEFAPVIPTTTTTPEPASLVLVGSGLAGLACLGWRRRKR
jgi:hypothetical protein